MRYPIYTSNSCVEALMKYVALLGEFTATFTPHVATNHAIQHSIDALGLAVSATWVSTDDIDAGLFEQYAAIWVAPGSPYKNLDRTLWAIRQARERKIPCFGTCGGFQHMVLEYARNVLGFKDAQHGEYDVYASDLFVSELECSLAGRAMTLRFSPGSKVAAAYGSLSATEEYYCNFGVNPAKVALLRSGELQVTGSDPEGEIRVVELPEHPYFLGTLFVPQAKSAPGCPHPLVNYFLSVVAAQPNALRSCFLSPGTS
jgi:CTP synthase (UTP-ammonia lyase)